MNRARLDLAGRACATILASAVACGGSGGAQDSDASNPDATANSVRDGAVIDTAQAYDASQDAGIGTDAGESGLERDADAGAVVGDSGSSPPDAAAASACEGGASVPPDASVPAPHICSFRDGGAEFPLFAKCCVSTDDCALGVYQNSCCGDTFALGMNRSQVVSFGQAVANWSCAACGCAGTGLHTEDGKPGVLDAGVKCDNGWCTSYAR